MTTAKTHTARRVEVPDGGPALRWSAYGEGAERFLLGFAHTAAGDQFERFGIRFISGGAAVRLLEYGQPAGIHDSFRSAQDAAGALWRADSERMPPPPGGRVTTAPPRRVTAEEAHLMEQLTVGPIPWGGYVPGLSDGQFAEARAALLRDGLAEYRGDGAKQALYLTAAGRRVAGL